MKKISALLLLGSFFAFSCSAIDQLIWNNEFNWLNVLIGFLAGTALALLGDTSDSESDEQNV